jgi:site-specific DNA-methyltransferase (cytosine-N4-specific)
MYLPLRCIAAGCPGGTVLGVFAGAGTTGIAARQLERQFIGADLVSTFLDIAKRRLLQQMQHSAGRRDGDLPGGVGV